MQVAELTTPALKDRDSRFTEPSPCLKETQDLQSLRELTPAELVDEYAAVVAEARALEERKKQLQELMDATGQTKLAGSINRVTIVTMPGAKTVMVKDMVADQVVSQSVVDSYTKQGTPFKQYRLSV